MSNTIKVLIYARLANVNQQGLCPVTLRVTIGGTRFEAATGTLVEKSKWSPKSEKLIGRTREVTEANQYFDLLRVKVFNIQKKFMALDIPLTIEEFKKEWFGVKEKAKTLLEIYQEHNNEVEQLVGSQYSKATWKKYHTSLLHTQAFLKQKYSLNDINVKQIQYKFITDFEFWLKTKKTLDTSLRHLHEKILATTKVFQKSHTVSIWHRYWMVILMGILSTLITNLIWILKLH